MDKKNKYVKLGILFIVIVIIGLIVKMIMNNNLDKKIFKYVENQGYVLDQDGLYKKNNSNITKEDYDYYVSKKIDMEFSSDTFDPMNFQIIRNNYEYQDEITSNLIATYDYKDASLIYTYRMTGNNINVIYRGNYNNAEKKFNCQKEVSYGVVLNDSETLICDKIELSILTFNLEAQTFFKNADFATYMKKQTDKDKGDHEERDYESVQEDLDLE